MELPLPFLERRHAWKKQNKQGLIFPFQSNALSRTHSQVRIPQPYRVLNLHCSPNSFQCLEPSLTLQDRQSVSGHFKGKLVFFQFLFFFARLCLGDQLRSDDQWAVARIDIGVSRLYFLSFSSQVLSAAILLSIITSFKNILYIHNMVKRKLCCYKF